MAWRQAVLAAILGGVLAACSTTGAPSLVTPSTEAALDPPSPSPTAAATPTTAASPSPSATPKPTPEPTDVPEPPKPTDVKFDEQSRVTEDEALAEFTQSVTWQAPRTEGVEIQVYGVTECVAEPPDPAPNTSGPCLVEHTPLPASVRTLLATAPAADGIASWTWTVETGNCDYGSPAFDPDGPIYRAVVLAAYNATGHSIFAIAEPGLWWRPGENDIVC